MGVELSFIPRHLQNYPRREIVSWGSKRRGKTFTAIIIKNYQKQAIKSMIFHPHTPFWAVLNIGMSIIFNAQLSVHCTTIFSTWKLKILIKIAQHMSLMSLFQKKKQELLLWHFQISCIQLNNKTRSFWSNYFKFSMIALIAHDTFGWWKCLYIEILCLTLPFVYFLCSYQSCHIIIVILLRDFDG